MAFDYIDYTRAASAPGVSVVIPGGQSWSQVFVPGHWLNPIEIVPGSQIRITNSDGSITYIYGTGLTLDPVTQLPPFNATTMEYEGGLITSMQRLSADGVTVYETIDFHDHPDLYNNFLGHLYTDGIDDWITAGDDTYHLNQVSDTTEEGYDAGTDNVIAAGTSYALGANVENLTSVTAAAFKATGNESDNVITTGNGNDTLDGKAGNDTLIGGTGLDAMTGGGGDDTYYVDELGDKTLEGTNQGFDTVVTSLMDYVLAANVEALVFTATGSKHVGTGNGLNNTITGSDLADRLTGLGGNDTLDGGKNDGAAVDSLVGGTGDDTYYLTGTVADDIVEFKAQGKADTVVIAQLASYTLSSELEDLVNTGTGAFTGIGNASANKIIGGAGSDTLYGLAGADRLAASSGSDDGVADDLYGGTENDIYDVYNANDVAHETVDQGRSDLVRSYATAYVLGADVENLTIMGGKEHTARFGTGNASINILTGDISDDVLDASQVDGVTDRLLGGKGDDTYLVDAKDRVIEKNNQGHDTVVTAISSYRLNSNIEDLIFTGNGAHTGFGSARANALTGGTGFDILNGFAGNDRLYGGNDAVADTLAGGTGDDTFVLADPVADTFIELKNQGIDTVEVSDGTYSGYVLAQNFEKLDIKFNGVFIGYGNSAANHLLGGAGANDLYGYDGNDLLDGGYLINGNGDPVADGSIDILVGGLGDDTYAVRELTDVLSENADEGTDTAESYLTGLVLSDTGNIENITIRGGASGTTRAATGNIYANVLKGDISDDTLDGVLNDISVKAGDTLIGGKGDDTYIVNASTDVVIELRDEGVDTVETVIAAYTLSANVDNLLLTGTTGQTGSGNAIANHLIGSDFADILNGLFGDDILEGSNSSSGDGIADTFAGGRGNDRYVLQDSVLDTIIEVRGQGIDTVEVNAAFLSAYTLTSQVENLEVKGSLAFTGTGNELNNTFIDSNKSGVTFAGLRGNDTYVVSANNVTILENDREGTDTVVARALSTYTLQAFIENLVLEGQATDNLAGYGNTLNNKLTGGDSNDMLDGVLGTGSDILIGGDGNDTYVVHVSADRVVERSGEGTDTVVTSLATYRLGANVENLSFTDGAIAHTGTGNTLDNIMTGNLKADVLSGGLGNDKLDGGIDGAVVDMLLGGRGDDTYVLNSASADTVVELTKQGTDTVEVGKFLHSYTLGLNVENLISTSTVAGDVNVFTGNGADNVMKGFYADDTLIGLGGKDTLYGDSGNDTLDGGAGDDRLHGGLDADTFVFGAGYGHDVVLDFSGSLTGGNDQINIHGFGNFSSYANLLTANAITQSYDGVHINLDAATGMTLLGLKLADIQASDFTFI